jgi:hypothetical protein
MKRTIAFVLLLGVAGCSREPLPPRVDFASRCYNPKMAVEQVNDCLTLARQADEIRDESDARYRSRQAEELSAIQTTPLPTFTPQQIQPISPMPSMPTPIEPVHLDTPVIHRDPPQSCLGVVRVQFYTAAPCL